MKEFISHRIAESIEAKQKILLDNTLLRTIEDVSQTILSSLKNGNKILSSAAMVAALLMHSTSLLSSAVAFT